MQSSNLGNQNDTNFHLFFLIMYQRVNKNSYFFDGKVIRLILYKNQNRLVKNIILPQKHKIYIKKYIYNDLT